MSKQKKQKRKTSNNRVKKVTLKTLVERLKELVIKLPERASQVQSMVKSFSAKSKNPQNSPLLILFSICVPLFFVLFLVYSFISSQSFSGTYTIDFTKENFGNNSERLYIEESTTSEKFGELKKIDGEDIPEIQTTPLSFVWQPEEFPKGKTINITAEIIDQGDWEVSLVCDECSEEKKYSWMPLYRGILNDYTLNLQSSYEDQPVYVYSKNILTTETDIEVQPWLEENVETGSSIAVLDNSYPTSELLNTNIDFIESKYTTISTVLRGPHSFYAYLKDDLKLSIEKEDLDWYDGADEVRFALHDLEGTILYEDYIEDIEPSDLIENETITKDIVVNELPYEGVYLLTFEGNSDWVINSFTINTNKIVTTGEVLPQNEAVLYTNVTDTKAIRFYIWHETAVQTVEIDSEVTDKKTVHIGLNELSKDQYTNIPYGDTSIKLAGDIKIEGSLFAFAEDSFFHPFVYDSSKILNPFDVLDNYDVIISNVSQVPNGVTTSATVQVGFDEIDRLNNLRDISIVIRNFDQERFNTLTKSVKSFGFKYLRRLNNIDFWGSVPLKNELVSDTNLKDWINQSMPEYSSIYLDKVINESVIKYEFINTNYPTAKSSTMRSMLYDLVLRGSHDFYIFSENDINFSFSKQDLNWYLGEDKLIVSIYDLHGSTKCKYGVSDDDNPTDNYMQGDQFVTFICDGLEKGYYILSIKEQLEGNESLKKDFKIANLSVNSNHVLIKDNVLPFKKTTLYTNNQFRSKLSINHWRNEGVQQVKIKGAESSYSEINLNRTNIGQPVKHLLPAGLNELEISIGNIEITGSNFSLTPESWYETHVYTLSSSNMDISDFALIHVPNPDQIYFRRMTISID